MIVSEDATFRNGVRSTLEASGEFAVIAEATNGQEAISAAGLVQPDLMLITVNLPGVCGLAVARVISRRQRETSLILLGSADDDDELFEAILVGIAAYCRVNSDPENLLRVARSVSAGNQPIVGALLFRPAVSERVLKAFHQQASRDPWDYKVTRSLTDRQIEILACIAHCGSRKQSNKQVAADLGLSEQTVKNQVSAVLRKLQVDSRTQAVMYAVRHGWIGETWDGGQGTKRTGDGR